MNRNKMILGCLLIGILFSLTIVGCKRRIEDGTSRSRTGEIKDYSASVKLVFLHELVGPRREVNPKGYTSTGAEVRYALSVNNKAVCQDRSLVFDGVESEEYDLTPYLNKGENRMSIVAGFNCSFPRQAWASYIGKRGMRLPVITVQILRGNQVTYQQDVVDVFNVYPFQGSNDLADIQDEIDQSTLSFTFYAE